MPPRSQSRRRTFSEALAAGLVAWDAQLIVAHRGFAGTPLGTALAKHGFAAAEGGADAQYLNELVSNELARLRAGVDRVADSLRGIVNELEHRISAKESHRPRSRTSQACPSAVRAGGGGGGGGGSAGLLDAALAAAAVRVMGRGALQSVCKQCGIEADGTTAVLRRELLKRIPAAGGGVPDTATSALTFSRALFTGLAAEDGAVLEGYGALLASPLCAALEDHGFHVDADAAGPVLGEGEGGMAVVHYACLEGHGGVVAMLIEHGTDVNLAGGITGTTPLFFAACKGRVEVCRLLVEHSADVNKARTDTGITPLYIAADQGHVEVCRLLLEHSADVDKARTDDGATPLCAAALNGHVEVCGLLVERSADVNKTRIDIGQTLLCSVAFKGHVEVCRLLVEHSADVNKAPTDDGTTPLCAAAFGGHIEVCRLLVEHSADVNKARTADGQSPLYIAVISGHIEVCRLLLEHSADVNNVRTHTGEPPLYTAAYDGQIEVCRLLVEHSADVNKARTNDGGTPLCVAAFGGHIEVCRLLVEHSADVIKARTDDGATPLCAAAYGGHTEVCKLLAIHGADPAIEDVNGCSIAAFARGQGHADLAGFLDAVVGWPALRIAAALQQPGTVRWLLRDGPHRLADPCAAPGDAAALVAAAVTPGPWRPWRGAPLPCRATAMLVRACVKLWSPERHWQFHSGVRGAVHTLLLVEQWARRPAADPGREMPPKEIWLLLCTFVLRADHRTAPAPAVAAPVVE